MHRRKVKPESVELIRQLVAEVISGAMQGGRRFDTPGNLRYGTPVIRKGGNVLDDEEAEDQTIPKAATCLIRRKDGKILAVSRRDDPNDFGLPGGKVDPGETSEDAAARELQEETGLTANSLSPVFSMVDAHGFLTTTFSCSVAGNIDTEEEGVVKWVEPEVLLSGSFVDYNKALFKELGIEC